MHRCSILQAEKAENMSDKLQPIDPFHLKPEDILDSDLLFKRVTLFIYTMLQHQFERLCALMYQHDVSEKRFNEALALPNDEERAKAIARLVIEREMEKVRTRKLYADFKHKNRLKKS